MRSTARSKFVYMGRDQRSNLRRAQRLADFCFLTSSLAFLIACGVPSVAWETRGVILAAQIGFLLIASEIHDS